MASDKIQSYSLTGVDSSKTIHHALSTLRPYLPVCLPLYRRLQFGRFFDATTLLTNVQLSASPPENAAWFYAFVDRSCRPETEVYLFGSWEAQPQPSTPAQSAEIERLLRNLVRSMKNLGVPTSIHQDILDVKAKEVELEVKKDKGGFSCDDYGGHMIDPNIMLWGATHERTLPILEQIGYVTSKFNKVGIVPNHTFIWAVDQLPHTEGLPQDLRWGELEQKHLALVRSRTQIPRQDRTLAVLPDLGIFTAESDQLVSWAFVGLDASLTTLHVEPEWRGKGLAKAITTKLFREKMNVFWEDGVKRLAHGYVINGNEESAGMCRSLGGVSNWQVYWLRVDLGNVS